MHGSIFILVYLCYIYYQYINIFISQPLHCIQLNETGHQVKFEQPNESDDKNYNNLKIENILDCSCNVYLSYSLKTNGIT